MKLNQEEITDLILNSLENNPDSWEFEKENKGAENTSFIGVFFLKDRVSHSYVNKDLDIILWFSQTLFSVAVSNNGDHSTRRWIHLSVKNNNKVYKAYLKHIEYEKDICIKWKFIKHHLLFFYLLERKEAREEHKFVFEKQKCYMGNGVPDEALMNDTLDINMSRDYFREERLKELLT